METKRNTVQRQLILAAVKELNTHATAEEVYSHVAEKHHSISKATVYRNLNRLVESGELINIGTFYGSAHYDHNTDKHCHFVCGKCRCFFDVNCDISDFSNKLKGAEGFDVTDFNLTFSGLCKNCK